MLKMVVVSVSGQRNRAALAGAVASFMACLAGVADPGGVADTAAGTYTLDYDTAYTVTAEDATAAEGLDIVKKGSGTVTAGADLASFAGEIRIEEGVWLVNDNGGLGTGAGGTVVSNGASLHVNYDTKDGLKFAAGETVTICGAGTDNKGCFRNLGAQNQSALFGNGGTLELSGDATVCGNSRYIGIGYKGIVKLNGNTLTINSGNVFDFKAQEFIPAGGEVIVKAGRWFLDTSTVWTGGSETTIRVRGDGEIGFRGVKNPVPYKLVLADGARLYPSSDGGANEWSGPVEITGTANVYYGTKENHFMRISGPISGSGGISVSYGETLRLSCTSNTFTGAVTLSLAAKLAVEANGAVPTNCLGLVCADDTTVRLACDGDVSLPASTLGGCLVSNAVVGAKATFAGITKTGSGTLNLVGGIEVANADVQAGEVKFGRIVPVGEYAGLYLCSTNFASQDDMFAWWPSATSPNSGKSKTSEWLAAANKLKDEVEPELVDYPAFAYRAWDNKYQLYVAEGYFHSNEPTNAVFTFTTSIADMAAVWIDGTCILRRGSSANMPKELGESGTTYFVTQGTLTLEPGPHRFLFVSGRCASSGRGPRGQPLGPAGLDWAANFGIGWRLGTDEPEESYPDAVLDAVVHSSNYTAVKNTADAVVITPGEYYTAAQVAANPGRCIPAFVSAAFANGTVLDLGDVAPYHGAAVIGNLAGTPTVANGLLTVAGVFEPTVEGLAVQPLTLDAAELSFGEGAAVSHPVRPAGAVRVAYAPDGSSITNAPSLAEGMEYLYRKSAVQDAGEGATSLDLLPFVGSRIGIR